MIPMETFITTRQASEILGMKITTVRLWLRKGQLPAVKMGRDWKIPASKLQAFMAALPAFGPDVKPANGQQPEGVDPPAVKRKRTKGDRQSTPLSDHDEDRQ
jgi:excisionase family DNA binding protein